MWRLRWPLTAVMLGLAGGALPAMAQSTDGALPIPGQTSPGMQLSGAPAAQVMTLQGALGQVYSYNPALLAERAKLRSVDENVPTALAGWRPTVVMNGSAGYGWGETSQTIPGVFSFAEFLNRDVGLGQVTLTQPVYTGGKTRATLSKSKNSVMAERARLIATEQQVFADTVNAFVTVIQDQQILALDINNEQVLAEQLRATNDRFRVGEITRTDVAQAEAALAQARSTRQIAAGNLQTAGATYQREVGALPGTLVQPQPLRPPVPDEHQATLMAAANNPNVIAALFDDAAAKDAIDVAFASLMPTVNVQATEFSQFNQAQPYSLTQGGLVTANINVPLYQGGSEYAGIRQARQSEQQARKTLDDQRRQAVQQAIQSWETLAAARAAIQSDRAGIRANEIALEGVQREAIVGSRTTLDVLNAEQALLNAQVSLVQNVASSVTASYNSAAAVGRLTARDLGLHVPMYDETAYYNAVRNRWFGTGDYATSQPGR